jgi:hypothetical protein
MSERAIGLDSNAPEVVIEVTPAMIRAGLSEFADRDRWGESDDDAVVRIYRAMEEVRRLGWKAFSSRRAKSANERMCCTS